jgi:hypothetical protein
MPDIIVQDRHSFQHRLFTWRLDIIQIQIKPADVLGQSQALAEYQIIEQIAKRHFAVFSGKGRWDDTCGRKQILRVNDGRESLKKLSELHKTILLLIVYETGLGILKGSFNIRNLIILKQAEITNSTVFNLSVLTISLSQIDKGCIFPSFVVWNHLNEHTGLLSYTTLPPI